MNYSQLTKDERSGKMGTMMQYENNNDFNTYDDFVFDSERYIADKYSLIADTFVNTNSLSSEEFFDLIFNSIFTLIPEAQKGSFYEFEDDKFRPKFSRGYDFELLKGLIFDKDEAFIDFVSSSNQLIDAYEVYIDRRDDSLFNPEIIDIYKQLGTYENFISLYAPIKYGDKKIGLISLENFEITSFSRNSKLMLKIYAQLISNYYTMKMHQQRQTDIYKGVISALVAAIEVKDTYTVGHANRVAEYSVKIAKHLKLTSERIDMIKTAAVLHDIGKIGIPNDVLNKPSKLTSEEYEIVKMHTCDTKKILESIEGFDEVIQFAYMHHEHYDGSGYPQGLTAKDLPIEAQIIQCADAFDAMTSDRAYRPAMAIGHVKSIFLAEKGKQFNPIITDIIIEFF